MIQRIQTLWLLFAAACSFLTLKFPFYIIGNMQDASPDFNATTKIPLLMLSSILAALCLIIIFIFKQRKLQMRLCLLALAISILDLYLYFTYIKEYTTGGLSLFSIFAFLIPLFLLLAIRGIYKDQKLLKSSEKLR
ncbi:MAG: DUF4293 domain-containing protein [Parafilimonas sp.]